MNALQSAQYSIAELHLQRRNPKATATTLEALLKTAKKPDLLSVTHLNLGELQRRHLHNTDAAVAHYRQVRGPLRHFARHYMLTMLIERGKAAEALKLFKGIVAAAKEKGEKLALLHQIGSLYKRFDMPDQALAVYQQITRDFTPDDIAAMRKAAAREANNMLAQMARFQRQERFDHAERLEWKLHQRLRDLRLARRLDEFEAFRTTMEAGLRELEARERRDDDEDDDRDRDDDRDDERDDDRDDDDDDHRDRKRPRDNDRKRGEF